MNPAVIRSGLPRAVAAVLATALVVAALAAGASAGSGVRHFFFAPGVTTSCELDAGVPKIGTAAYCQTYPHAESVILSASGKVKICHGIACIGNPPDQTPTLVYTATITTGPFRCTSLRAGVRCVVARTGRGFLISPTAIRAIG